MVGGIGGQVSEKSIRTVGGGVAGEGGAGVDSGGDGLSGAVAAIFAMGAATLVAGAFRHGEGAGE